MDSKLSISEAFLADPWGLVLFVINVIGAASYVIAASHGGWVTPQVRELHAETAEPFIWALSVFPICAVFLLLNVAWGAFLIARRQRRRPRSIWWLMTIPIWLVAIAIDFAHH